MAAKPGKSADILDAVALVVVDMQTSLLNIVENATAVVDRCGFAIEAARTLGLRVVFTEQVPAKLGGTDPRLLALVPNARVFAKNSFSALQAEGLPEYLRRQGAYHLLLVGIEIPVCIYQTALHAVDSDFDVTVLSDCVTGRRLDDCLVTLEALTRAHCHLLPSETVYYSMLGNAGHPLFSPFNALVKRYAQVGGLDSAPPPPAPRESLQDRRPVLVAPEDRPEAQMPEDAAGEPDEAGTENEPYVGRDADGAPAGSVAESTARHEDGGEDGAEDDDRDGEAAVAESDDGEESDDEGDAVTDGERDEQSPRGGPGPQSDQAGRRRRGRRRRGGARRRRSRERREGAPGDGGGSGSRPVGGGDSSGQSAPPQSGERAPSADEDAPA